MNRPRVMVVVGSPGSGKDLLIRAVHDMGSRRARVVPKHTDRPFRRDEGSEMFFPGERGWALPDCDVTYNNFGSKYGLQSREIWAGLKAGTFQVVVVSNIQAINRLRDLFSHLLILVYVHSTVSPDQFRSLELKRSVAAGENVEYVGPRADTNAYRSAFALYVANIAVFDHVLIYADVAEDLYDQIFRLFDAYESGRIR